MIDTLRQLIRGSFYLAHKNTYYLIAKKIRVYPFEPSSLGFSLDKNKPRPFTVFSDGPPPYLTKICDAIVVYAKGDDLYFVLIEQKTKYENGAEAQLLNGKLFCQWLVELCKKHDYGPKGKVEYYGVLVWEPGTNWQRGTSVRPKPQATPHKEFNKYFSLEHYDYFDVLDLIGS